MATDTPAKQSSEKGAFPRYARVTGKDQLKVPEPILAEFPDVQHFRIVQEEGRIVLTPVLPGGLEAIRDHFEALGITEQDIADAVAWARGRKR